MQERYDRYLQEAGLPRNFFIESTDSESSDESGSENLAEMIRISKNIIDSSDESGDENFDPNPMSNAGFDCNVCGKNFMYKRNLQAHWKNLHSKLEWNPAKIQPSIQPKKPDEGVICGVCKKVIRLKGNLSRHLRTVHPDYDLSEARALSQPMQLKTIIKNEMHPCEECGKQFGSVKALKNHAETHNGKLCHREMS